MRIHTYIHRYTLVMLYNNYYLKKAKENHD